MFSHIKVELYNKFEQGHGNSSLNLIRPLAATWEANKLKLNFLSWVAGWTENTKVTEHTMQAIYCAAYQGK